MHKQTSQELLLACASRLDLTTFTLIHSFPLQLILSAQTPEGILLQTLVHFPYIIMYGVSLNFDQLSVLAL